MQPQSSASVRFRPAPVLFRCGLRILLLACLLAGCGYNVGPSHDRSIVTVEVPTFENNTFRRGIEQQLTEAVQKEIQKRTAIQIVRGPGAQTRLTGKIIDIQKQVLGETREDDPRELQLSLVVEVKWEDLRSGQVISQDQVTLATDPASLYAQSEFAPEVGHSLATALQQSIQFTARRIVDMMDAPW